MKKTTSILMIAVIYGLSAACTSFEPKPDGVWASVEAYESWKANPNQEDLVASKREFAGATYLALPNSTYIGGTEQIFLMPGMEWKIQSATKVAENEVVLKIVSVLSPEVSGSLRAHFITPDRIYFVAESGDPRFTDQFVTEGKNTVYARCDIAPM